MRSPCRAASPAVTTGCILLSRPSFLIMAVSAARHSHYYLRASNTTRTHQPRMQQNTFIAETSPRKTSHTLSHIFYFNMLSTKVFGLTLEDYFKNGRARLKQLIKVERAKIFSRGGREERLADFYTGFIVSAPRKASFVLVTSQVVLTP